MEFIDTPENNQSECIECGCRKSSKLVKKYQDLSILCSKRVSQSDGVGLLTSNELGYCDPKAEWSPEQCYSIGTPFMVPALIRE